MIKKYLIGVYILGIVLTNVGCCDIGNTMTTREQAWKEFANPQDSTRTKVWWFHGETETTREGITADLEAYKRGGVGGVVYYDQAHGKGGKCHSRHVAGMVGHAPVCGFGSEESRFVL